MVLSTQQALDETVALKQSLKPSLSDSLLLV